MDNDSNHVHCNLRQQFFPFCLHDWFNFGDADNLLDLNCNTLLLKRSFLLSLINQSFENASVAFV